MYVPTQVYIKKNRSIETFSVSHITPAEVYKQMDTEDVTVYLAVRNTVKVTDNVFGINFSELITDTNIGHHSTWSSIAAALTQAYVLGYSTRIPGYVTGSDKPKQSLITWNMMSTFNTFDLAYSDHLSNRANIPAIKWSLNDLRIRIMEGAGVHPNLANCLPIVNGIACKPLFNERLNNLYALGGARYLRNEYLPELQLLDFNPLGKLSVERIARTDLATAKIADNTTTVIHRGGNDPLVFHRPWVCWTNKDLREYTPIVVLAGSIVWPDEIFFDNEHQFRFRLFDRNLNRIRVWGEFCQSISDTDAAISYRASQIIPYFDKEFAKPADDGSSECFVVYIKSNKIVVHREPLRTWRGGLLMDHYAPEGVLIRDITHSVHTYYSNTMTDRKLLRVQLNENLYFDSRDDNAEEILLSEYNCQHADLLRLCDSSYTMVYLLS